MRPTLRLVTALLMWAAIGAAAPVVSIISMVWPWLGVALGVLGLIDAIRLHLSPAPEATRALPPRLAQGTPHDVRLTLRHSGKRALRVTILDRVPPEAETTGQPWIANVPPGQKLTLDYALTLRPRGLYNFGALQVRWDSPWSFWHRHADTGEPASIRVYPNYQPIVRHALLALANRETADGLQHRQRQGASRSFHQLRDYQEGDSLATVDWAATSRRMSLISREYREERNQHVLLAIDCGRRLRAVEDGLPQFDHALNALLLLAYLALRQGDHVSVLGLGEEVLYFPPRRGVGAITLLLDHIANYQTSDHSTDFAAAAAQLQARQKQRALLVIVTNLRSEDPEPLVPALQLLRRRHLTVLASLQDNALDAALKTEPQDFDGALATATANFQQHERELALATLRATGTDVLDTTARELPIALAQHYLDIKRRGRL